MRHVKSLLSASVLVVSLSAPTLAGSITTLSTGSITTLKSGSITTLRSGSITTLSTADSSSATQIVRELSFEAVVRDYFSRFFIALW